MPGRNRTLSILLQYCGISDCMSSSRRILEFLHYIVSYKNTRLTLSLNKFSREARGGTRKYLSQVEYGSSPQGLSKKMEGRLWKSSFKSAKVLRGAYILCFQPDIINFHHRTLHPYQRTLPSNVCILFYSQLLLFPRRSESLAVIMNAFLLKVQETLRVLFTP